MRCREAKRYKRIDELKKKFEDIFIYITLNINETKISYSVQRNLES